METWYHSGLEGYCKATARLMELPDNNSGWGNVGNDLFADGRFGDSSKANRTWTLARARNIGCSNRPTLFEQSWLGASGPDLETEAVFACADSICDDGSDSALSSLFREDLLASAAGFSASVLPAIEDGFRTERYHSADIMRFAMGIEERLGDLNPLLPQTFRSFVIPLVAGLIYGPGHVLAQSHVASATLDDRRSSVQGTYPVEGESASVRVTQLLGEDCTRTGYSEVFGGDQALLFGRGGDVEAFMEKCDPVFAREIEGREKIVFPIAKSHKSTSKEHGIMARIGETWYYHDFSLNGSCVSNAVGNLMVHESVAAIAPGDRLCLGIMDAQADEAEQCNLASKVLVTLNIDESAVL